MLGNEKGMGLVQVMVAAGMLGLISVGVMKLTSNMQKGQSTVELKSHKQDSFNTLRLYLANPSSCEETFAGLGKKFANGETITEIRRAGSSGPVTVVNLTPGSEIGNEYGQGAAKVKIESMSLQNTMEIRAATTSLPGEGTAELVITYAKGAKNTQATYGGDQFQQKILLSFFFDTSNDILSCYDQEGGAQAACEALGGEMSVSAAGDVTCHGLTILEKANGAVGIQVANEINRVGVDIKPNEISFYDPTKNTGLHIRSWGLASDIESVGGPLVLNNAGVPQKYYTPDPTDTDGDGELWEEQTTTNDGRVQIGDYAPTNTDTLYVGGTIFATGNISTTADMSANGWSSTSDIRLKEDIAPLSDSSKVLGLEGVSYRFKGSDEKRSGFIAQEVGKVLPHLVTKDADGMLGIRMNEILPYLVEELKKSHAKIESLENRIKRLELRQP